MGLRTFGLAEEEEYGVYAGRPVITQRVNKGSAGPGQDPITLQNGSRSVQAMRAGYMKPTASTESSVDSKTLPFYLLGLLGNYKFTPNYDTKNNKNAHEFFGGENTKLPSFTGVLTYDIEEKILKGLLCDEMKIEAKDDLATNSIEWIFKSEKRNLLKSAKDGHSLIENEDIGLITDEDYPLQDKHGIPYIGYDFSLTLNDEVPTSVISDFNFDCKNNHNVDGTIGLGARSPQKKATAQQRELSLSLTTTMDLQSYALLVASEYGEYPKDIYGELTPSPCKLYTTKLGLEMKTCEDATEYVKFIFPKCIVACDPVETSESDEMTISMNLTPTGVGNQTLLDGSVVNTDFYALVVNDQPQIKATKEETSTTEE